MKHVISQPEMQANLAEKIHPLDPSAKRSTFSLGDASGLSKVGLHYTVLKPGHFSTVSHFHHLSDEFLYILEGTPTLYLGGEKIALKSGDFVGLPARGGAHTLENTTATNVVYLVGGDRPSADVTEYPDKAKRLYIYETPEKRHNDFVAFEAIENKNA